MAKQIGPFKFTGCIGNFYRLEGHYYDRMKSSLDRKRVLRDKAFQRTMENARVLGLASKTASLIFRATAKEKRDHGLFRRLTGMVMRMLRQGKTREEAL